MKKIIKTFVLVVFVFSTVYAQPQLRVSGTVKDNTGDFLPGVSIVVKGTTQGTVTDIDGKYSLNVPGSQSVLVFSFVGMETQEINVSGRSSIDVVLNFSSIGVDEVVVTALGMRKEKRHWDTTYPQSTVRILRLVVYPTY